MLQTLGTQMDREQIVKQLFMRLDPKQLKGLKVTDEERTVLVARLDELKAEIESASRYEGAILT